MNVAFCLLEWFGPVVLVDVVIGSFVDACSTVADRCSLSGHMLQTSQRTTMIVIEDIISQVCLNDECED